MSAQQRFTFDPDLRYDEAITSPTEFLGYEPGDHFTFHHKVMDYFKQLDEESDRLSLHRYAETYEGRGLYYAVISSEKNHTLIDEIKSDNRRLADPDRMNRTSAEMLINNHPVTVWLSYNVHGNEASGSEAAMQSAYRLVAAMDDETRQMREQAVVVIDPMINPDGRDRYVYYYKTARSQILNSDPYDLEHDEPWPGGRTNHYWFDLNRDWVWLVHPESRGRIAAYQQWMPQVHLDIHEQGFNSNYFTMPGTTPRNQMLPKAYDKWATAFGNGVIAEFDKHNVNYATREAFDFFYPGYGSSYPSLMGGIGMLAEQGGHSRGGRSVETEDGYLLTLRQRVFDHYTNSIATVRTAVQNRQELLNYYRTFFTDDTRKGETEAYILPNNPNDYTYELLAILHAHGVEIKQATESFSAKAYSFWDGNRRDRRFNSGDFIISTDQPRHIFLNTLMKRQMEIRDSVMYDMSTWSATMAYNLDAAWTEDGLRVDTKTVDAPPVYQGQLVNGDAGYAYVIDWKQRYAPNALSMLWQKGYRVRSAMDTFTKNGRTYGRGSLIVLLGRNYEKREEIGDDMAMIADSARVEIVGFDTGRMEQGMDLASRSSQPIEQPKVALMVDNPFNSYTAGQIWFLMEQWSDFGISRLRTDALRWVNLDRYDVLILPDSWGSLSEVMDSTQQERLKRWVASGGTLIADSGSALFLTKEQSGMTPVASVKVDRKTPESSTAIEPSAYTPYAARSDSSGLKRIPGTALKGHVDVTHPLGFGVDERVYTLKMNTDALMPAYSLETVGYYEEEAGSLLASGYISADNRKKLAGKAFAGVHRIGSGKVIFLVDNTQYRMFWMATSRMMQNAILLMPGM